MELDVLIMPNIAKMEFSIYPDYWKDEMKRIKEFFVSIGLISGIGISLLSEQTLIGGKSVTDIAKDKANEKVTAIRNSDTWKNTKKATSNAVNDVKHFGASVSSLFS